MRVTDLYQVDTFRLWRRDGCGNDELEQAPTAWAWPPDGQAWSRALQIGRRALTSWLRRALGLFKWASKVWQSMLHQTSDFNLKGEGFHLQWLTTRRTGSLRTELQRRGAQLTSLAVCRTCGFLQSRMCGRRKLKLLCRAGCVAAEAQAVGPGRQL